MIFATVLPWRTTQTVSPFSTRVKISDALLRNSVNDRLFIDVRPPSAGLYITAHWCAIAGRAAQGYIDERKERHGAFWEGRYHATAAEAGEHLNRCLVYLDLNMIRAGVVSHPEKGWARFQIFISGVSPLQKRKQSNCFPCHEKAYSTYGRKIACRPVSGERRKIPLFKNAVFALRCRRPFRRPISQRLRHRLSRTGPRGGLETACRPYCAQSPGWISNKWRVFFNARFAFGPGPLLPRDGAARWFRPN